MVFNCSLSKSKPPQVPLDSSQYPGRPQHSIIWMVSSHPLISNSYIPLPSFWGLLQVHQLQLVSPSHSCSIAFLVFWQGSSTSLSFRCLRFSLCDPLDSKIRYSAGSHFFKKLLQGPVIWPELGDLFIYQNPREFCVSHSPGQTLVYAYTICFVWSNINFLHNSLWITPLSCLILVGFLFTEYSDSCLILAILILPLFVFFLISMAQFSIPNSIPTSLLNILIVLFQFLPAVWCRPSTFGG